MRIRLKTLKITPETLEKIFKTPRKKSGRFTVNSMRAEFRSIVQSNFALLEWGLRNWKHRELVILQIGILREWWQIYRKLINFGEKTDLIILTSRCSDYGVNWRVEAIEWTEKHLLLPISWFLFTNQSWYSAIFRFDGPGSSKSTSSEGALHPDGSAAASSSTSVSSAAISPTRAPLRTKSS